MSNVIDLLLNADLEQIERPSKEVEIKRLTNIYHKLKLYIIL